MSKSGNPFTALQRIENVGDRVDFIENLSSRCSAKTNKDVLKRNTSSAFSAILPLGKMEFLGKILPQQLSKN